LSNYDYWRERTLSDDVLYARSACSALVITCSDFRFKRVERAFAESAGLADDYDLIARPGGIRSLVAPRDEASGTSMAEEIALLRRLHGFTRVLMLNHLSCRAYDDLTSGGDERGVHVAHLGTAARALGLRFAGISAEQYLVALTDGELRVERLAH
jgi:hypothetical protein